MDPRFVKFSLEKLIVAKVIGVMLLIADYFHRIRLTDSLLANIIILISASYLFSSIIIYLYEIYITKRK